METKRFFRDTHIWRARSEGNRPGPFGRRESGWLILDLNPRYLKDVMLPELVRRHLGNAGGLDYNVAVVTRSNPASVIYQSGTARA